MFPLSIEKDIEMLHFFNTSPLKINRFEDGDGIKMCSNGNFYLKLFTKLVVPYTQKAPVSKKYWNCN